MSTDYDCWHESKESVTFELILKTMATNAANVLRMFPGVIRGIQDLKSCDCRKGCNVNSL